MWCSTSKHFIGWTRSPRKENCSCFIRWGKVCVSFLRKWENVCDICGGPVIHFIYWWFVMVKYRCGLCYTIGMPSEKKLFSVILKISKRTYDLQGKVSGPFTAFIEFTLCTLCVARHRMLCLLSGCMSCMCYSVWWCLWSVTLTWVYTRLGGNHHCKPSVVIIRNTGTKPSSW